MYRRLYFTFPDINHTQKVVNELIDFNITSEHMHAMSNNNVGMGELPRASSRQKHGSSHKIERKLWAINLSIFGIASVLLLYFWFTQNYTLSIVMLAIMFISIATGFVWASIPCTPVSEFDDAMHHDDILLMIDVPENRIKEVGDKVHRQHPEAIAGGTSWMIHAFDM
jgi:hypothetical protein